MWIRIYPYPLLICLLGIGIFNPLKAQNTDSVMALQANSSVHSPHKATILSLIVPGAGQFYNRKYWKIPIVYGALAASGYYFVDFNNKVQSQNTYFKSLYAAGKQPNVFEIDQRDNDRVNRDVAGIAFVLVYVLQVVDATVDAHFFQFNIDQNLGLQTFKQPEELLCLKYTF